MSYGDETNNTKNAHLPARNNGEVHRRRNFIRTSTLERLRPVSDHSIELLDCGSLDGNFGPFENFGNVEGGHGAIVAVPQLPEGFLDTSVACCNPPRLRG